MSKIDPDALTTLLVFLSANSNRDITERRCSAADKKEAGTFQPLLADIGAGDAGVVLWLFRIYDALLFNLNPA